MGTLAMGERLEWKEDIRIAGFRWQGIVGLLLWVLQKWATFRSHVV